MQWEKKAKDGAIHTHVGVMSWCKNVEPSAEEQAYNVANHPRAFHHVALMPDAHMGYGMPIGGVAALRDAVSPNMVGVDIGCGMHAVETNIDFDAFNVVLDTVYAELTNPNGKYFIPVGEGHCHKEPQEWDEFARYANEVGFYPKATPCYQIPLPENGHPKVPWCDEHGWELAQCNLGTLGGGNHFIEFQKDANFRVWFMIHSGSRNLGHRIATHHNEVAQGLNATWDSPIPNKDLAYLPTGTKEFQTYVRDMDFALFYALENRKRMMQAILDAVFHFFGEFRIVNRYDVHHNYAVRENHFGHNVWVHRKGATSARKDQIGIIPGDMGSPSYIVRGLGNIISFMSCSHGAGRAMSRTDAALNLKEDECYRRMKGIKFGGFGKVKRGRAKGKVDLSEAVGAYKDIGEVMRQQEDLVEIVHELKPFANIKG